MLPRASQLDSFTDVFRDEFPSENISQPISLPSSADTIPESPTNAFGTSSTNTIRPLKGTGQHGEFRSVEEIDPKYRCLFTFPYFNLVQSRVIEDALYSDKSLVLCAPTGSGKTVAFEMAILQLLMQVEDTQYEGDFKIIYMAPVKAVCNERLTEWYPKLTKLGLLCVEVTGDTEVDFSQLKPYKVIITTPEKWDMLTRRWRDHRSLVEMIKLFLIDEVHILNDETRGPVLETVVSRMKTIESAAQSAHRIEQLQGSKVATPPPRIRFVAISATVSNPEDVATWLGTSEKPAVFYKFGEECRPVKLRQIVEGYPCAEGTSIFKFDIILNYKLWSIIQKYYNGKPTLIFCNTRKSVALTAETLSREITVSFNPEQKAKLTALASTLKNKKLQMLVMSGVGCHHAGLLYEERVNIERAFRNRDLPILITTTTLAMGVNLPAHLVIIKNTQQYVNGAYQEYSISTVLQMVGRAGRPQFDTEATAVIMTRLNDKARYQSLVGGSEPLQSYLHKRIAENLNSEAALGTVTDVAQCVEWLRSTFLYVRAAKDPKRYLGLPPAAPTHLILKKIEELCVKAMNGLASSGLITMDEASCIESTEAGRLMSIYYLDVETMKNIMKIDGTENLESLLWLVCESHELSEMHLRMDERRCLNLLNRNKAAATIRFPMRGKISTRQMKMNCIIQAILGCLHIPEPSLNQEAMKVMKIAGRVCRCLVRYVSRPELVSEHSEQSPFFSAVINSIILAKCIEAHLWENSPYVSKQLKGIGPTFSTLLASAGITSFMLLEESHPRDLERIMNRGPPAGNVLRKQVSLLPKYQLTATPIDNKKICVQLMLLNHGHLSENMDQLTAGDSHKSYLIVGDSENNLLLLTQFTDRDLISVYDGIMKFEIARKQNKEHKIMAHCISSNIAGIDAQAEYTFLDLEPLSSRETENNYTPNQNLPTKNTTTRQTNITDVYKERKRKANSELDITQCKEKKKQENAVTEKLKALKESFGKTSKELKKDIHKSAEESSKLLDDLLKNHGHPNIKQHPQKLQSTDNVQGCAIVDLTKDNICEPLEDVVINDDDDDYMDDSEIDNILSKIESEISGNAKTSNGYESNAEKVKTSTMQSTVPNTDENELKMKTATKVFNKPACRRFVTDPAKRKNIHTKSNFSFIDLIDKKANTSDKDEVAFDSNDNGFSDTIKSQIRNFLQRTHETNLSSPAINERLYKIDHTVLPTVHVKRNSNSETSLNKLKHHSDKANSKSEIDVTENVDHELLITKVDDTELPPVYVKKSTPNTEIKITSSGENEPDAGNSENKTEKCSQVKSPIDKNTRVQVQKNCENDNLHLTKLNCSLNKYIQILQDAEEIMSDNNQVLNVENKLMPCDKSYENKVEQLEASSEKSLVTFPSKFEKIQGEIKYANTMGLVVPSLSIANKSNKEITDKLPAVIYNPVVNMTTTVNDYDCHKDATQNLSTVEEIAISAKESLIPYQFKPKTIQCNYSNVKAFTVPDPSMIILSNSISRCDLSTDNKNPIVNIRKQDVPSNTTSFFSENVPSPQFLVNQQLTACSDDANETHVNRYTYTATKIDVCTKNNADHQLRITRQLKVDVDITESITKEKIELNKMNSSKNDVAGFSNIRKNELKSVLDNERKLVRDSTIEDCAQSLDKSNSTEVIRNSDNPKIIDEKKEKLCNKDFKTKDFTTSNSIGNILQKYSKILSKPETHSTPVISRINENNHDCSTSTTETNQRESKIAKSRRPFRIKDIHTIAVPAKTIIPIIEANGDKPAVNDTQPKRFVDVKKHEMIKATEVSTNTKSEHDFDFNVQGSYINEPSPIQSPISVLSLELDPTENLKDENMFNPKAVLQYFNTDANVDTEVIEPPPGFGDDLGYSPTIPIDGLYENDCSTLHHSFREDEDSLDNINNLLDKGSEKSSPKKVETWCLSRDEGNEYYTSQPMSSVPWLISQRASNSQLSSGFGSSRTRLDQFKFVRKKPLRPR